MDLTITIPAEAEARVGEVFCRLAGHETCNDPTCIERQVLRWISNRVTAWEQMQARIAAESAVPPLSLEGGS